MVRFVLFLLSVIFVNTASAQMCVDLFQKVELAPYPEPKAPYQPADIREHGMLIDVASGRGLGEVTALLASRDGTYPLIIDTAGNIMIDHRLPDPNVGPNVPYLGTHRGLYQALYTVTKHRPQIVFAGQIRVVGGRSTILIDQAGTFFQRIEDFKQHGDGARDALTESNQQRLEWAARTLSELGLIAPETALINFQLQFRNYGQSLLNEGHVTARKAADFERRCRADAACAEAAKIVDRYLRWVIANGGKDYIMANLSAMLAKDMHRGGEFIQWMNMFLNEGVFDVMAAAEVTLSSAKGAQFEAFLKDLPEFLPEVK